jgi:membrane-bound serine protease (ClpP class)
VLQLGDARIVALEPNWQEELLATIADPNVALLLIMIGVYGLIIEFYTPGMFGPGVIGGICLLLGMYGLAMLPLDFAGVALLVLGIGLMIAEAFMPSIGAIGIGGVIAFVIGALMLVDADVPELTVSWQWVLPLALVSALLLGAIGAFALRARSRPRVAGREALLGAEVTALEDFDEEGWVQVFGERWHARSTAPLARGMRARVTAVDGLLLNVEPQAGEQR